MKHNEYSWLVPIFKQARMLLKSSVTGRELTYKGSHYAPIYHAKSIFIAGSGPEKEILVGATNVRSLSCIVRLDNKWNFLAEYWHSGHLNPACLSKVSDESDKSLVLFGGE
jgi:hypothetical protein